LKYLALVQRNIDERKMMTGDLLLDPAWNALATEHERFMVGAGRARRYPAAVVPFAAVADYSQASWANLEELLAPGEHELPAARAR
jgi:hypothetical protein